MPVVIGSSPDQTSEGCGSNNKSSFTWFNRKAVSSTVSMHISGPAHVAAVIQLNEKLVCRVWLANVTRWFDNIHEILVFATHEYEAVKVAALTKDYFVSRSPLLYPLNIENRKAQVSIYNNGQDVT